MIKTFFKIIKDEYLEKFAFILLFLWTISPIIEYIFKNNYNGFYTCYFSFITYVIGIFGIITYIIYMIKNRKEKKYRIKEFIPIILIIILVILGIISSIFGKNTYLSIFGEMYRKEGLIVYIMYAGIILLSTIIKNKKYMKLLFKSIIFSCLITSIIPLFDSSFTYLGFASVFHQFNHYGYYLMINIMLSAFMFIDNNRIIKKVFYLVIYIFLTYLLIRNDTFGSYLAIVITFFFIFLYSLIKKYKRINVILLILVFTITSFCVSQFDIKIGERVNFESTKGIISKNIITLTSDVGNIINKDDKGTNKAGTGRGLLWKEAINYTLEHPIIGGGMESLNDYYHGKSIEMDRPHNIILQISSFIGIPGAIIYIVLILYIAITNLKIMKDNTIHIMIYFTAMAYFISSMFGNSMYYNSPYFMILLGLLIGFNFENKRQIRLTK